VSKNALIVEVRLMTDRWHGSSGYPPSPFRLFQALVAGAYGGRWRASGDRAATDAAFRWLENQSPPIVIAPRARMLGTVSYFVPNNDLDSVGNDPRRVSKVRVQKMLRSTLLESEDPFAYIWQFEGEAEHAERIAALSDRLHTFGRGIDGAFARAIVVDEQTARAFSAQRSALLRFASKEEEGHGGSPLECPVPGSLDSLHLRYASFLSRLRPNLNAKGRRVASIFRQPPKAQSRLVAYDRPSRLLLFDIREAVGQKFYPIRIEWAAEITTAARDLAFDRLEAIIVDAKLRERLVLGRGADDADRSQRVRFIALPSIGTRHTDASIRRIVVELPPDCPISEEDVRWALAGRALRIDRESGEVRAVLVPAADESMLRRYIFPKSGSKRWQTVTPAALPRARGGGRVGGAERSVFERSLAASVCDALRHANVSARPTDIRVQREPLFERGTSAERFEAGRFGVARLYHVEIRFADPVVGPLIIGDGRWLGLGLMRPLWDRTHATEIATPIEEGIAEADEVYDDESDGADEE
jgi:CRISPR-associated protein Csb2